MRRLLRIARLALWTVRIVLLALVVGFAAGCVWLQTGSGKAWLAGRIEAAVSAPGSQLAIGTLSGAIPFSPTVGDLTVADDDGVWLTIDHATVRLAPMALFSGIARIEVIEAGRVAFLREPLPGPPQVPEQPAEPFAWPDLPVDLEQRPVAGPGRCTNRRYAGRADGAHAFRAGDRAADHRAAVG